MDNESGGRGRQDARLLWSVFVAQFGVVVRMRAEGMRGGESAFRRLSVMLGWCVMMAPMYKLFVIVCLGLFVEQATAQMDLPPNFLEAVRRARTVPSSESASTQFMIHGAPSDGWRMLELTPSLESNYVRLEPAVLSVSCERIKSALLSELGAPDQWAGHISIFLHQARRLDEPVIIEPMSSQGEWTYYMGMPDTMEKTRLVSAIVNIVLLETANRDTVRSAEIPAWLAEGLTQDMMVRNFGALVVESPKEGNHDIHVGGLYFDGTNAPPLEAAHDYLTTHPPLTLEELAWPRDGQTDTEAYRMSAQLFVRALLQMNDGAQCLRRMIRELPRHLNWQMSFLDAFHSQFGSQLEVEKWWDLCLVDFTGRDLAQTWSHAESWQNLDAIMRTPAAVRTSADELPMHTEVSLQALISGWGYDMQKGVLTNKIRQLQMLRGSVSQDMIWLVDNYQDALQSYVNAREKAVVPRSTTVERTLGPDQTALDIIRQLNYLDIQRQVMRNPAAPETSASAGGPVNH
jgi:hypothetical protein